MELINRQKEKVNELSLPNHIQSISTSVEGKVFYCQNQSPFIQDVWVTWNFYRWYHRYLILNKETNVLKIYAFEKDKHDSKKTEKLLTKEIKLQQ